MITFIFCHRDDYMDDYIYSQSVHKDFHGGMSYLIKFIRENHGEEHMKKFFSDSAVYLYKPLIDRIKKNGLSEIKKHYQKVFNMEEGKYSLESDGDREIIFKVDRCPAIWHMKDTGSDIDKDYCYCSTELANSAIARECDFKFSVAYDQDKGQCVQKFWKEQT